MSSSKWVKNVPTPLPRPGCPDRTSPALLTFPSPLPCVLTPAKACIEVTTSVYVTSRMIVDRMAARPGVRLRSFVSSLTARAVSQPQ